MYVLCTCYVGMCRSVCTVLVELMGNGVNTIIIQSNPNFTEAQSNHYK